MINRLNYIGIIPARYASTRFPGKPLADVGGKTMVQRVYEQARMALDTVYVATDDERILNSVHGFGGNAVMTSAAHRSGTDRCREAVHIVETSIGMSFDVVLNIQGDEPFIQPEQLEILKSCFQSEQVQIATLMKAAGDFTELMDPNRPKVIVNYKGEAMYFSRSPIPYLRGVDPSEWIREHDYYLHIGLYAYRKNVLNEITRLEQSALEVAESLEQLRWLENGYRIFTRVTEYESFGIDTPGDLEEAVRRLKG